MTGRELVWSTPEDGVVRVVNPDTGEVLALADAESPVIALVLGHIEQRIGDQLDAMRDIKRVLGGELIERMDKKGEWTITARGVKVVAPSPVAGTDAWDAELLDSILDDLVREGVIDQEAKLRAVEQRVTLATNMRGISALCKIPAVRERIAPAHRTLEQGPRKVSVRTNPSEL